MTQLYCDYITFEFSKLKWLTANCKDIGIIVAEDDSKLGRISGRGKVQVQGHVSPADNIQIFPRVKYNIVFKLVNKVISYQNYFVIERSQNNIKIIIVDYSAMRPWV